MVTLSDSEFRAHVQAKINVINSPYSQFGNTRYKTVWQENISLCLVVCDFLLLA